MDKEEDNKVKCNILKKKRFIFSLIASFLSLHSMFFQFSSVNVLLVIWLLEPELS